MIQKLSFLVLFGASVVLAAGETSSTGPKATASSPPSSSPSNDATTCSSGSDERILAIAVVDEGCELTYTKSGESKRVAGQKVGLAKCEEVKGRIENKLKAAGYKCK